MDCTLCTGTCCNIPEGVGCISCTRDYSYARVETTACFRFLTSTAPFPRQHGLGPNVNLKYQLEVKLHLGSLKGGSGLKMLQVGQALPIGVYTRSAM